MVTEIRNLIIAIALSNAFLSCTDGQENKVVSFDISMAMDEYNKTLDDVNAALVTEIDKKLLAAQQAGDLKGYERLDGEKNKFILEGVVPPSWKLKQYESATRRARSKVDEAYALAVKSHTVKGEIEKAKVLQAEFDHFRDSKGNHSNIAIPRNYWSYATGYFMRAAGGDWIEKHDNGKKLPHLYTEIQSNDEFIELKNCLFPFSIRLYADRAMVKDKDEFNKVYEGSWRELKYK